MFERFQGVLATCSYRGFDPRMGVPVATSIGRNKDFATAPEVNALKPWGVFKKLSDLPLEEQRKVYHQNLTRNARRIHDALDELALTYPGTTLVILCWCHLPKTGMNGCHRRWAARWFKDEHGIDLPELGMTPRVSPPPMPRLF